ncbi:MAG: DEAD/DEAH box helicase [Ktedonobacterales bacterium]
MADDEHDPRDNSTTVMLELRGRDLALVPPAALWPLPDDALYAALFGDVEAPGAHALLSRDRRGHFLRARPSDFARLRDALRAHGAFAARVAFDEHPLLPVPPEVLVAARPYQEDALRAWRAAGYRGVVVLPTGAGKTVLGALAIADLGLRTLVVVPTIDLLRQWRAALHQALRLPDEQIGTFGGGEHGVAPVTVMTYESAQLHPELLRRFGLLVFDECHHLPAPTYRQIAEGAFTPYRLGLSATPERADQEHVALQRLIGPEVYRREPEELSAANYLAAYDAQRLPVRLSAADQVRYDEARTVYRAYLRTHHIAIASPADFQRKVLWASARDSQARAAMLAWRAARSLALNAPAKLALLETLFLRHAGERVLVFSEYNSVVEALSRRFAIPAITHKTPLEERRAILDAFRAGRYTKLASGRVLNEGVDIPDCGVAVIVSGTATRREYVQRLGRILRPKATRAVLYELVTEGTAEERISERRKENP